MNNIRRYCCYIFFLIAIVVQYSPCSNANGCNFPKDNKDASCKFPQIFIHHCTDFVPTAATGGPSTYFTPLIKVQYRGCGLGISDDGDATITVGKPYRMKDFTYVASIEIRKEVCDNKDVYASTDPKITAFYNKMCNDYGGVAVGICSYYSKVPNFLTDIASFFVNNPWSAALSPAWAIIRPQIEKKADELINNNYGLIDCFPVPMAPLPPPFCNRPLDLPQKVDLFRICEKDETSVIESQADDHDVCVLASQEQNYSTYTKPCVRVTFDVKTQLTDTSTITNTIYPNKPLPKGSFINFSGGPAKESLYQAPWQYGSQTLLRQTKVYDTTTTSFLSDPQFWGYNDGQFIDLCYDYLALKGQQGSITESSTVNPATRTFEVIRDCENQGGSCYIQGSSSIRDPSTDQQICIKELLPNRDVSYHGCVPRPLPPKPTVSFCPNNPNVQGINNVAPPPRPPCLQFSIDPEQPQWNKCSYVAGLGPICQILNPNYQPILTNKCFDTPTTTEGMCVQYDCTKPGAKTNTSCPKSLTSLSYTANTSKPSGATKLCLMGYPSAIAKPWCPDGCNRMCTKPIAITSPTSPTVYFPSTSLMDRVNPPFPPQAPNPPENYPLPDNAFCPYSIDTANPPQSVYRPRNPIEDDLCVDVFLFDFVTCSTLKDPKDQDKCKTYTEMCLQEQQSKDGYNKHYTNFDLCNNDYVTCAASGWKKCQSSTQYNCCNYFFH